MVDFISFKICHLCFEQPRNLLLSAHVLMKSGGVEEIRSGMGVFATFLSSKETRRAKGSVSMGVSTANELHNLCQHPYVSSVPFQ